VIDPSGMAIEPEKRREIVGSPEIATSPLAVDELLSYLDGTEEDENFQANGAARCEKCGDVPVMGDAFCGNCGAPISH